MTQYSKNIFLTYVTFALHRKISLYITEIYSFYNVDGFEIVNSCSLLKLIYDSFNNLLSTHVFVGGFFRG